MTMNEERIRRSLRAELDTVYPDEGLRERLDARLRGRRRTRPTNLVLALATAAVLVTVAALAVSIKPHATEQTPAADPYATVPTPPDVKIIKPSPSLPHRVAALSGTWEGLWDERLPSRLTVERIGSSSAQVIYAYGVSGVIQAPGWRRLPAQVSPSGTISWDNSSQGANSSGRCSPGATRCHMHWTFSISTNLASIEGRRVVSTDVGNYINLVTMHRAGAGTSAPASLRGWIVGLLAIVGAAILVGAGVLIGRRGSRGDRGASVT